VKNYPNHKWSMASAHKTHMSLDRGREVVWHTKPISVLGFTTLRWFKLRLYWQLGLCFN